MARLKFGAFLAPHHPIGEHPMLQFRRDIAFVEQLDELGYDEFWCGEHHSSGWEMIASPEMFLAAAGERTKRIKLGTGIMQLAARTPANAAMSAMMGAQAGSTSLLPAWMQEMFKDGGFPIKGVNRDSHGKEEARWEATKIEKKPLDDRLFLPPAGYTKQDLSVITPESGR